MHDHLQAGGELGGDPGQGHARRQPQGGDPVGHSGGRVGVQRATATLVPGVEAGQHVEDLRASHLPDDQAIRAHAQGLADQRAQRDLAGSLDVGRARLQAHHMRMLGGQLSGVLHDHDPLASGDEAEQGTQHGRLAGAGAAGDQKGHPSGHDRPQPGCRRVIHRARGVQVREREPSPAGDPDRDGRAAHRQGRDDRVQPLPARQPGVHPGHGVIEPPAGLSSQPHRQLPHRRLPRERHGHPHQPAAAVDPHVRGPIDQDVCDRRVAHQRLECAESTQLVTQSGQQERQGLLVQDDARGLNRPPQRRLVDRATVRPSGEDPADPLDKPRFRRRARGITTSAPTVAAPGAEVPDPSLPTSADRTRRARRPGAASGPGRRVVSQAR